MCKLDERPLLERLLAAQVGGCNCLTKSPDTKFHSPVCHYRLHFEAAEEISRQQVRFKNLHERLKDVASAALEESRG